MAFYLFSCHWSFLDNSYFTLFAAATDRLGLCGYVDRSIQSIGCQIEYRQLSDCHSQDVFLHVYRVDYYLILLGLLMFMFMIMSVIMIMIIIIMDSLFSISQ